MTTDEREDGTGRRWSALQFAACSRDLVTDDGSLSFLSNLDVLG